MKGLLLFCLTFTIAILPLFPQTTSSRPHYFRNNFPGGQVIVDSEVCDVPLTPVDYPHNTIIGVYRSWSGPTGPDYYLHSIDAINNQMIDGYQRIFYQWIKNGAFLTSNTHYQFYPGVLEYEAQFHRLCNVSFHNNDGTGMVVNGISYGSSTPIINLLEQTSIVATAPYTYSSNGINFVFQGWAYEGGGLADQNITVTAHRTYTAKYIGYPPSWNRNLTSPSPVGQPITLTWSDHPISSVTYYQIWQMITHNGVQTESYIANVNRGVQSFTDGNFIKTSKNVGYTLSYDVRAVHGPTGGTTMPNYISNIYGDIVEKQLVSDNTAIPLENKLYVNFPNPFNPSTQIKFALKEDSYVSLKVYDILGKEVKTLVSENISAGSYTFDFDGNDLPSGLYIYALKTKDYSATKKMMLTK